MLQRLLSNFSFIMLLAIITGILIGDMPFVNEISTIALITAMTVSISHISFRVANYKRELRKALYSLLLNYGFLSSIILVAGFLMHKYWEGFVIMASAPPAIAVVPITKILHGDERQSLFSLIFLYLLAIFLMPFIIYLFLAKEVDTAGIVRNTLILILVPIVLSRAIYKKIDREQIPVISNICFFILISLVIGKNRNFLFEDAYSLLLLSAIMAVRTFGTGSLVKLLGRKIGVAEEELISYSLLSSFKNEGLVMLIALSFSPEAAIPAIIALIFELLWVCCMEAKVI